MANSLFFTFPVMDLSNMVYRDENEVPTQRSTHNRNSKALAPSNRKNLSSNIQPPTCPKPAKKNVIIHFPDVPETLLLKSKQLQRQVKENPQNTTNWWVLVHFYAAKCKLDATQMLEICEQACHCIEEEKHSRGYAKLHLAQCKYLSQCHRTKEAIRLYKAMSMNGIGKELHYFWVGYATTLVKEDKTSTAIQILSNALEKINSVEERRKVKAYLRELMTQKPQQRIVPQTPSQLPSTPSVVFSTPANGAYDPSVSTPAFLVEGKRFTPPNHEEQRTSSHTPSPITPSSSIEIDSDPSYSPSQEHIQTGSTEIVEKEIEEETLKAPRVEPEVIVIDEEDEEDEQDEPKRLNLIFINGHQYQPLSIMGKGGSASVIKALGWTGKGERKRMEIFAIKQIKFTDDCQSTVLRNEVNYLVKLRGNKSIVHLYDYELTHSKLSLVLELGEIDLRRALKQLSHTTLQINAIRVYWQQMLEAVGIIHDHRIVHTDLKPANFVICNGYLKLIDFGIAGAILSDTTSFKRDSMIGTLNYISPEALQYQDNNMIKLGTASDIWSLGVILYEMVFKTTPFASIKSIPQKVRAIVSETYEIEFPSHSNTYVIETIKKCLQRNPKNRPTTKELLQDDFLL